MIADPVIFVHGLLVTGRFYKEYTCLYPHAKDLNVPLMIAFRNRFRTMQERAEMLEEWLTAQVPEGDFHLIGHSAGGLDSAWLLQKDTPLTRRCRSLTAMGTPFLGTPIADMIFEEDDLEMLLLHNIVKRYEVEQMVKEMGVVERRNNIPKLNAWTKYFSMPFFMRPNFIGRDTLSQKVRSDYSRLEAVGHSLNDGTVPTRNMILPGSNILRPQIETYYECEHKAQTVGFRYGRWPWQTRWKKNMHAVYTNIAETFYAKT